MARAGQDFEVVSGDTKYIIVTIYDADGKVKDLSNITAIRWVLKRYASSSTVDISKTLDSGIEIVDAVNGKFRIKLLPEDTEELNGFYYHEAEATDELGDVSTLFTGGATITIDGAV